MYTIFGYTWDLCDFEYTVNSFVHAVKECREIERGLGNAAIRCGDRNIFL